MNLFRFKVKRSLDHRTLRSHHQQFVVFIPKSRADAPRVAKREHFAAASDATQHVPSVPNRRCLFENVGHVDVVFDIFCNLRAFQPHLLRLNKIALALSVKPVSQLFEQDVGVRHHARVLSLRSDFLEDFLNVCHVEVGADT